MNRILVVNINWLGDAVFSTPVFKALKTAYPQAHVACLCVPRLVDVLKHCPDIDEIIVYDEKGKDRFPWNKLSLIGRLRSKKFDIAFLLHKSRTRLWMTLLAGIPKRISYSRNISDNIHRMDHYLSVVEDFGIKVPTRQYELNVHEDELQSVQHKLRKNGLLPGEDYIVFNTGGNWLLKRIPLYLWIDIAKKVSDRPRLKVVFSGNDDDQKEAKRIIQESRVPGIIMAGQTNLGESLALFQQSKCVLSADSGPLHLACSVGAPVVSIFGPTRPEITGPRGKGEAVVLFKEVGCNKAPCYHLACIDTVCMRSFGVDDVWQALQKFIN